MPVVFGIHFNWRDSFCIEKQGIRHLIETKTTILATGVLSTSKSAPLFSNFSIAFASKSSVFKRKTYNHLPILFFALPFLLKILGFDPSSICKRELEPLFFCQGNHFWPKICHSSHGQSHRKSLAKAIICVYLSKADSTETICTPGGNSASIWPFTTVTEKPDSKNTEANATAVLPLEEFRNISDRINGFSGPTGANQHLLPLKTGFFSANTSNSVQNLFWLYEALPGPSSPHAKKPRRSL